MIWIGKQGQTQLVRPAPGQPTAELVQASLVNARELCDLHTGLHETFAAANPDIRNLRSRIATAAPACVHGA